MNALLDHLHSLRDQIERASVPAPRPVQRTFLPREKIILVIDAKTGAFDRGLRLKVRDDSDAGAAEAIIQMLTEYAHGKTYECGPDGEKLTVSELLDASLKRDLAEPRT